MDLSFSFFFHDNFILLCSHIVFSRDFFVTHFQKQRIHIIAHCINQGFIFTQCLKWKLSDRVKFLISICDNIALLHSHFVLSLLEVVVLCSYFIEFPIAYGSETLHLATNFSIKNNRSSITIIYIFIIGGSLVLQFFF